MNTGCFSGDTAGFPVTIDGSAGQSYLLTSDLKLPDENSTGIFLVDSATHITLDLGGFEIRGVTTCSGTPLVCSPIGSGIPIFSGCGVFGTGNNHVMNGTVVGAGNFGVLSGGVVEKVRATQNASVGIVGSFTVRDSVADLNGSYGIFADAGSLVTGNTSSHNGSHGIKVAAGSIVSGNTAYQNEENGIEGSGGFISDPDEGVMIIDNTVYDNGGSGIECDHCTVRGNTVRGNSSGIELSGQSVYRENVITNNSVSAISGPGVAINRNDNYCAGAGVTGPFCP